jgi:outer membrane murein-binding lipoprotein Lpp
MGLLDKAKAAAEQAAAKAKEGVEDVQTKRELGQTQSELGRIAFELIEAGEISHAKLDAAVAKIRELNAKMESDPSASNGHGDGASASSAPPAMPT